MKWFLLLLLCTSAAAKPATPAMTAQQALAKLQAAWDGLKSFECKFEQVVIDKRVGDREESAGTLSVVKPDKLRWDSQTDRSLQILNGNRLINLRRNRRRGTTVVDIWENASKNLDSRTLKVLAGQLRFAENYSPEVVSDGAKQLELKLKPKGAGGETLIAEIDKESYLLRALITDTGDSRIVVKFSELKKNPALAPALFEYQPAPEDVVHRNP